MRKGIILAGGSGTRLAPLTASISKHLLPVYDKPMIYYPLSVLMLAGIREILVISTPTDIARFEALLGDGRVLGISVSYAIQTEPRGIAEALLIADDFIGSDPIALMLGDNILYGGGLSQRLQTLSASTDAVFFAYQVRDPQRYGVVTFDADGHPGPIVEKPTAPTSSHAVIGLYFYPNDAIEVARTLTPAARGELEITDVNNAFLAQGRAHIERMGRGIAWFDAGTATSLLAAGNFVAALEERQNLKIGCIEEIAWRMGWITPGDLQTLGTRLRESEYGRYILSLCDADA